MDGGRVRGDCGVVGGVDDGMTPLTPAAPSSAHTSL